MLVEINQQSKYKGSMFAVEVMVKMHSYNYLMVVLSHLTGMKGSIVYLLHIGWHQNPL